MTEAHNLPVLQKVDFSDPDEAFAAGVKIGVNAAIVNVLGRGGKLEEAQWGEALSQSMRAVAAEFQSLSSKQSFI